MIADLLESQTWLDAPTWRNTYATKVPASLSKVLLVTTSLTRFLEQHYALNLDVHVYEQAMGFAQAAEAALLHIGPDERCLRRKVSLLHRNRVMFDAESILPLDVLPVELMAELEAGQRPLANLLSERGLCLSRSDLSISHIQDHDYYEQRWARRSVLRSESGATALVTEVFHEALWSKLNYLSSR
ncbi:MAG: chorismate lyase [Mariprofundaceae bacterium]|nr:chorismate lyase [Mariprofundaceae bacterium]